MCNLGVLQVSKNISAVYVYQCMYIFDINAVSCACTYNINLNCSCFVTLSFCVLAMSVFMIMF